MDFDLKNIKIVFRHAGWYIVNIGAVYFLEYTITTSFADRANPKKNQKLNIGKTIISDSGFFELLEENAFAIL